MGKPNHFYTFASFRENTFRKCSNFVSCTKAKKLAAQGLYYKPSDKTIRCIGCFVEYPCNKRINIHDISGVHANIYNSIVNERYNTILMSCKMKLGMDIGYEYPYLNKFAMINYEIFEMYTKIDLHANPNLRSGRLRKENGVYTRTLEEAEAEYYDKNFRLNVKTEIYEIITKISTRCSPEPTLLDLEDILEDHITQFNSAGTEDD
ncbi:DhNV_059 [Dikerogammarus haemobaphes nudivirus]|nr:DhNV_059 [Dikerogammarus haemobaphes nudivirus]